MEDLLRLTHYDVPTLRRWLHELRFFRVRVASPYVQDSDYADDLRARVRAEPGRDFESVCVALGLAPDPLHRDASWRGVVESAERRGGAYLRVRREQGYVELCFSGSEGSPFLLDDRTIALAKEVERELVALGYTFLSLDEQRPYIGRSLIADASSAE